MANDNSFDVASQVNAAEVNNAVQQALKEVTTRYDLKDSNTKIAWDEKAFSLEILTADDYKLKAVTEILQQKLFKRGVSIKAMTFGAVESASGGAVRQTISLQNGIPGEKAKEVVRVIKDSKLKVQAAIQGDIVRVSGKDRDTLQQVIALLRGKDLGLDLQFINYRSA